MPPEHIGRKAKRLGVVSWGHSLHRDGNAVPVLGNNVGGDPKKNLLECAGRLVIRHTHFFRYEDGIKTRAPLRVAAKRCGARPPFKA